MLFKDFSIFSSGGHFIQQRKTHSCNFGRRHYGEDSCEIILNSGDVIKRFSYF